VSFLMCPFCVRTPSSVQATGPALVSVEASRVERRLARREGCATSVSSGEVVFVDEAAEPVAALDGGDW
jgi:hypothetical protein